MRAVLQRCYGSGKVLRVENVPKPEPASDQVLVRVRAASVNPLDWHSMTGKPYVMRLSEGLGAPSEFATGVDFAGIVESVGARVVRFKPGEAVFGARTGAFAEFIAVSESGAIAHMPDTLSFQQAAALPIAAVTALQGLRDHGQLRPGQKVLINGASGGVGTFAVQLAKNMGAHVTAVCSTRNLEMVRHLGADHVIDYTREDFTRSSERYDLIVDAVGNHSLLEVRNALTPHGTLVIVGGDKSDPWLGPLWRWLHAAMLQPFVQQRLVKYLAAMNQKDLELLARLSREGSLSPVIDREYPLEQAPAALDYVGSRHARGKVVIRIE